MEKTSYKLAMAVRDDLVNNGYSVDEPEYFEGWKRNRVYGFMGVSSDGQRIGAIEFCRYEIDLWSRRSGISASNIGPCMNGRCRHAVEIGDYGVLLYSNVEMPRDDVPVWLTIGAQTIMEYVGEFNYPSGWDEDVLTSRNEVENAEMYLNPMF